MELFGVWLCYNNGSIEVLYDAHIGAITSTHIEIFAGPLSVFDHEDIVLKQVPLDTLRRLEVISADPDEETEES